LSSFFPTCKTKEEDNAGAVVVFFTTKGGGKKKKEEKRAYLQAPTLALLAFMLLLPPR